MKGKNPPRSLALCVEDFRSSISGNDLIHGLQIETGIHGVGEFPGKDFSAIPACTPPLHNYNT